MKKICLIAFIALTSSVQLFAQDKDVEGSKDHEIITRYPGTHIRFYHTAEYAEVNIPTAIKEAKPAELVKAKGKYTSILYTGLKDVAPIQVFRNYEQAIKAANGEILFSCTGKYAPDGCDDYGKYYGLKFFSENYKSRNRGDDQYLYITGSDNQAFITAVFEEADKRTYVEIGINESRLAHGTSIQLEIIEEEKMIDGLVSAKNIGDALQKDGKIAMYGIQFETGKSTLLPESNETLNELVSYLKSNPKIKLYVVGHTDDTGNLDSNMQLSKDRAAAVVTYLTGKGIAAERLLGKGVGPLSPESNNTSDNGKKLNRRVELVLRLK